ncbi:non-hydrolyzing UDP-N-acetylglucosamine 2-epimerase [Parashewanella tropica]|uniref:non-hydrolyzing UDP-N-acetylglucosamine 2-epimerase n=1 Tax=Parashewanella tropica TaxID=2547970 RepID=UPI00105A2440|nr:UDP-N-acetylglucosamine 2-epimerase (non-hydrolyzing) [Parashewanella tropica]
MKIVTVLGARPQFVKAATLSRQIKKINQKRKNKITEIIIHTGQHYDENMSDIFFEQMEIPRPNYILQSGGKTHGAMTGEQLIEIEKILMNESPDYVLVYGDTNSTLAGALSACKMQIPVIHVESGLRSFNKAMPEEVNRILTDQISDFLFCPTDVAVDNVRSLKKYNNNIYIENIGDVMNDACQFYMSRATMPLNYKPTLRKKILVTIHRAENTDDLEKLSEIVNALNELNKIYEVIFPIHPRTLKFINQYNLSLDFETYEPFGYLEMLWLLNKSDLVLTDSGGLQKEAYFLKKWCITVRGETEWVELIDSKVNVLVRPQSNDILNNVQIFIEKDKGSFFSKRLYGDGNSAEKILNVIVNKFNVK